MITSDSKILVTGGTGSLGTALIQRFIPKYHNPVNGQSPQITAVARNETKMNELCKRFPLIRGEIGDVRDLDWLRTIFPGHDYVIHAGALKVVPTAEVRARETVTTNVLGSLNVAMAAVEARVKRVIGVSTDKACESQTTYGASKMLMESCLREANTWSDHTTFNLVRYGNVLGSNQSVVPFFQSLVADNKPIRVTEFKMSRFWLSMLDAIDLIEAALNWEESGVILVPKAKASDMLTLARAVVPSNEYPIIEVGKRPGEKIHEKMIHAGETYHSRDAGKYFVIYHPAKEIKGCLPEGFEYTSNTCPQFTVGELKSKIREYSYV